MTAPVATVSIDWANNGDFSGANDDVTSTVQADSLSWTRGRSADWSGEATGSATFTLVNTDDRFTPNRNLCNNPSFEAGGDGWDAPVRGVITGCTIAQVADTGAGAGSYALEITAGATAFSGRGYTITHAFKAGTTYSISFMMKSISGDTYVLWGVAGTDDVNDYMEDALADIGTSWVRRTIYWTPYADHTSAGIYTLHVNASASVWRIDGIQVSETSGYVRAVLDTYPTHHWQLDETEGAAHDIFGENNGVYTNTPSRGQARLIQTGRSAVFDGTDAVDLEGDGPYASDDNFTLAAWIRPTSVAAGWHAVFGSEYAGAVAFGLYGDTLLVSCTNVLDATAATGFTASINTTYFIAATYDWNDEILTYYVNGQYVSHHTFSPTWDGNPTTFIGCRGSVGEGGFIGTIDEATSWDAVLDAEQIAALYAAGIATPTSREYVEGPTATELVPGRPVHIYATYGNVDYPQFFGYIERLSYDAWSRTVTVTCYDPLRRFAETDVAVAPGNVKRTARDFRVAILEDMERGDRNLASNPHLVTDTSYWFDHGSAGGLSRITTDHCPETTGNTCLQVVAPSIYHIPYTPVWSVPQIFKGVTYRGSVWLKWVSGSTTLKVGLGGHPATIDPIIGTFRDVTITSTWQKFTVTYTPTETKGSAEGWGPAYMPFSLSTMAYGAGTYLIDGAQITRGQVDYPYTEGGTGRSANYCANGSFDGAELSGWYDGWKNLIANPSFETNTTGWAGTITRVASDPKFGSAHATINANAAGVTYNLTGTFKAGKTYDFRIYFKLGTAAYSSIATTLGSSGTPADATTVGGTTVTSSWVSHQGSWTPSADRTDAILSINTSGEVGKNIKIDGAMVVRQWEYSAYDYSDTGPGGGGLNPSASYWTDVAAAYGEGSQYWYSTATAGEGRVYDFNYNKPVFLKNQPYTISMWVLPSDADLNYKVGIGANKQDGTWDEASVTGTASRWEWTQITCTWTPTADYKADQHYRVAAFIYQTDATANLIYLDGVRVIPSDTADDFEMPQWDLGAEADIYMSSAAMSGTALTCLNTLNGLALTRHWIEPRMASPYYAYKTSGRADIKTLQEYWVNDISDMSNVELGRDSIINTLPITWSGGTEYYSDSASVTTYGVRPGQGIDGSAYFDSMTIPDSVGASLIARYKGPKARPQITLNNYFTAQIRLELDDLVEVTVDRLRVYQTQFVIAALTTTVTGGGAFWNTVYQLEEYA